MRRVLFLLLASLATACGAASGSYATDQSYGYSDSLDSESYAVAVLESAPSRRSQSRTSAALPMPPGAPAPAELAQAAFVQSDSTASTPLEAPPVDDVARPTPLLIYTAQVTLAIYDVTVTQETALAAIEEIGGYASERNNNYIVFRVPAERFRETLDLIGELGDVLNLDWQASDVSEQYRDLDIRLTNALEMRERLQALLDRATEVEDMLYIEQQLERITLEIERIRGQLRVLADQIAYSTITVYFSRLNVTDVPTNEFRLPFPWLNTLGLERLLAL